MFITFKVYLAELGSATDTTFVAYRLENGEIKFPGAYVKNGKIFTTDTEFKKGASGIKEPENINELQEFFPIGTFNEVRKILREPVKLLSHSVN